ncbi:hypothetical protein J2X69_003872 [Algoriphagus sp. 4150]|uniref:DUF4221 family protein n=1 Tax=Algoriphagus sp. 4150 TaxID=2817756 RepID=UPI00285AB0FF|nr:DUF4221 family protein [Algoriphagus sp. 4150]MDR7131508.1 hypothetical protein [Algoriphagus sp. 4150]
MREFNPTGKVADNHKKLFALVSIPVLFSCGSNTTDTSENLDFSFSYTIDTVEIHPGDHLIYISGYMNTATISPDKNVLYNLNPTIPELEIIDLEALAFREALPLEKEGPEGIGMYVSDFAVSEKGDFIFLGYQSFVKASSDLDHYKSFKFQSENLKGDTLIGKEGIDFGAISSRDGNYLFATYSDQEVGGATKGLAIVDLQTMELTKIAIRDLETLKEFNINQYDDKGNPRMSTIERVWLLEVDDKIYLTNTARNEAFIYDLESGALKKKGFHAVLTSDAKKGQYAKNTTSAEEMKDAWAEKNKEVEFNKLLFDETNGKFWRVSQELDRMIADSVVTKKVLTIFDSDLNQLHEQELDFEVAQSLAFFKEGILYSFVNLEDELGFIRIKPSYE